MFSSVLKGIYVKEIQANEMLMYTLFLFLHITKCNISDQPSALVVVEASTLLLY